MILVVQGSRNFDDYGVFMNGLARPLKMMDDNNEKELTIYSVGPRRVNNMATEFANVSEDGFKSRGIKIKLIRVTSQFVKDNIHDVDYFAYFCKRKEVVSELADFADAKDVNVGVFRF